MATEQTPTVYQALLAAGVPLDSHESDLYAKVTPESRRILAEYGLSPTVSMTTVFISQIDGERWYDLPFRFDPFWAAVARRGGASGR